MNNDFQKFDEDFRAFHKTIRWALGGAFVIALLVIVLIAVVVLK